MEPVERFLSAAGNWVWGPPMLLLVRDAHRFLTVPFPRIEQVVS